MAIQVFNLGQFTVCTRVALALIFTVSFATCVFAQGGIGGRLGSEVLSPFTLTIGDPQSETGKQPPPENDWLTIPFTFTVSIPVAGTRTPKDVRVCISDMKTCTRFSNIVPPQQMTGALSGKFRMGNPVQIIACEDTFDANGQLCGEILATDEKAIVRTGLYSITITNITVFHTRAHSTDSTYVTILGGTNISNLNKKECSGPYLSRQCWVNHVGEFQDGDHVLKYPFPIIGDFAIADDSNSSIQFGFAVWNFGAELVSNWGDLSDALFDAAVPVISAMSPSEQIDITPALNDHFWQGCDGPTAGTAFRITGAQLEQLTHATGRFSQTIGRYVVPSQVGCGASSQYSVTFVISRSTWFN